MKEQRADRKETQAKDREDRNRKKEAYEKKQARKL